MEKKWKIVWYDDENKVVHTHRYKSLDSAASALLTELIDLDYISSLVTVKESKKTIEIRMPR